MTDKQMDLRASYWPEIKTVSSVFESPSQDSSERGNQLCLVLRQASNFNNHISDRSVLTGVLYKVFNRLEIGYSHYYFIIWEITDNYYLFIAQACGAYIVVFQSTFI